MRRLHVIFLALLVGFSAVLSRGTERPQHNFLIIVDSSVSMAPHKSRAIKWVREAIATRFDEQIEAGDSIDIWTYDTDNNLRGFPPQIWQPQDGTNIANKAAAYLEKYPFKGRSDFAQVASDLALLVPQTKALLIVIITDGEEPFSGVSLDLEINGFLAKKGKVGPAAAAKAPLLISLSAIGGALRTWTAYFGEGRIDLATLPERNPAPTLVKNSESQAAPKQPAKQQQFGRTPVTKPRPLIPSGETKHVFDFPAGTVFNPGQQASPATALERPFELGMGTKAPVAAKTNVVANVAVTNVARSTNALATNLAKIFSTQSALTNVGITAGKSGNTNVAIVGAINGKTNQVTNIVLAAATRVVSNSPAPSEVKATNIVASTASSASTPPPSIPSSATLRQAMYATAIAGVGCILAGVILIVRKLRRPTQSIISRSLLQR